MRNLLHVRLVAFALLALSACAARDPLNRIFGPDGRTLREAIAEFPEEKREGFALMQHRCSKCHSLDVPFSAHLPKGAWRAQVRVMAKRTGAGIPPTEEEPIAQFLEYFFEQRRKSFRGADE